MSGRNVGPADGVGHGMIGVPLEVDPDGPCERCCFCRAVTDTWTALADRGPGEQVACCDQCAKRATAAAVPSKAEWCEREAIATGPSAANKVEYFRARERYAAPKRGGR